MRANPGGIRAGNAGERPATYTGRDSLSPSCQSRRLTTILMVLSRRPLIPRRETKCRSARYVATCGEPALSLVRCSATGQGTSRKYADTWYVLISKPPILIISHLSRAGARKWPVSAAKSRVCNAKYF